MASARRSKVSPKKKGGGSAAKKEKPNSGFRRNQAGPPETEPGGSGANSELFLLTGLALTVAGIFSLPNFHLLLAADGLAARLLVHPSLLALGFATLVFAFRRSPGGEEAVAMPRWQAYPWFAFFFGLCFFWRFYHPLEPSAPFWFDNQVVTGDIAAIVDAHQNHLLFPWGQREAFFPYLTAGLWELLPSAGGVWIIRFSCTVIDLIAIWGLYLLGSTLRGRRLGLILMAFWAVSLPMTIWNYFGMGQNTAALAAIWVMVFFFRLIQKPTLARFLYWGAAVAFGAYCYVPFRPWTPSVISLVLLWVFFSGKEKPKGFWPLLLAGGWWLSWAILFFYKNNYLPVSNPLVAILAKSWFLGLVAASLLTAYVKTYPQTKGHEANRRLFGWATGAFLTAILMAPVYLHPSYSEHTTQSSVFMGGEGPLPLSGALKGIFHNIYFFFSVMFGQPTDDVSRYPLPGQSYFESFPELGMVIGLAYFIARPSWRLAAVLLMALVGMTSLVFSNHPHTGRVESAVPPLLLIGAWGFDAFLNFFRKESKSLTKRLVLAVLLAALWAWDAQKTFEGIRTWMAFKSNDAKIGEQLDKDWEKYRVIISVHYPEFATPALTVLCDQKEAYTLNDPNPIYLEPGQKGKDIVFLMYGSTRFDKPIEDRVRAEFPQAQWSVIECPNPDIPRFMLRAVIPMDALAETKGKLFYIERVPKEYWRRRFYWKDYGVGRGMVWWDDRVPSWKTDFPPGTNEFMSVRVDGQVNLPLDGDYVFTLPPTIDVNVLSIDGKTIAALRPQEALPETIRKIYLKRGLHQVSYVSTFRRLLKLTEIKVTPPGGGAGWLLGQPPLDSQP